MHFVIYRSLFLALVVCMTTQWVYAQDMKQDIMVKGTVIDSLSKLPVEMATVVLMSNGRMIGTTETDSYGKFRIGLAGTDHYTIAVSFVGYKNYTSRALNGQQNILVYLQSTSASLKEITVTAKKPLMQSKGDKLIYNAAADVSNKAGTAADVLRKAPLLNVGADGELKLRGNSNIKVLLNGMPSGIMAKNLKEALKMIPASTIQSVEIITAPSAKYEAEGAAGVINIITKKAVNGTNGSIDISGGNLEQSINGSLNVSREKTDFTINVNANRNRQRNVSTLNRTAAPGQPAIGDLFQQNDVTQYDLGSYIGLGIAYRPDSTQRIGADLSYWAGSWPAQNTLYTRYSDGANTSEYNQQSKQTGNFQYYELALNYQKKYSRKGQELQVRGLMAWSMDRFDYTTNQYDLSGFNYFTEKAPNKGKTWEADIQADYTHPLSRSGKNLLETGWRYTHAGSHTAYQVFNNQAAPGNGNLAEIAGRSDAMDYSGNIYAAYASLKIELKNKWIFRPGIRFEGTRLSSSFKSNQPSFNAGFSNWVPALLISKKLNDKHELKFNYTERIRRPFIWDLNPYVNASDPRNLTAGNPQLRPETVRMLELGHSMHTASGYTWNSSIYYSANKHAIESFTTVDAQGVSRTMPGNVATVKKLGANVNAFLQINPNWMATAGLELYQVWFKSRALNSSNSGFFYAANLNTSYTFPAFTLQLSGDYSNGSISLQGNSSAYWTYRFSVQKELLNKNLSVLLSVSNPFQRTMAQRSNITAPAFSGTTFNNFYNRAFSISASWKFGAIRTGGHDEDETYSEGAGSDGPKRRR